MPGAWRCLLATAAAGVRAVTAAGAASAARPSPQAPPAAQRRQTDQAQEPAQTPPTATATSGRRRTSKRQPSSSRTSVSEEPPASRDVGPARQELLSRATCWAVTTTTAGRPGHRRGRSAPGLASGSTGVRRPHARLLPRQHSRPSASGRWATCKCIPTTWISRRPAAQGSGYGEALGRSLTFRVSEQVRLRAAVHARLGRGRARRRRPACRRRRPRRGPLRAPVVGLDHVGVA